MTYRQLGDSGLTVSAVGIGCNNFGRRVDQDGTNAVVRQALDSGITLFDTADIYGQGASEEMLGLALGSERENVVVATKFGMDMQGANGPDWGVRGSRRYVRKAVESSLRRLGTDWIDLYQFHTPDPQTPIDETLAAMDELVTSGKVRYIGHSNRAGWQIAEAEFTPAAEAYGLGVLPYFPLANGLLTGKYAKGHAPEGSRLSHTRTNLVDDADWDQLGRYSAFAAERDLTEIHVAFSWLAAQPSVSSVIA